MSMATNLKMLPFGVLSGKVILLNAPMGCGKDYAAERLVSALNSEHHEFKHTIYAIAMAITGLSSEKFFKIYNDRSKKELPQPEFFGLSPREMMIWISEDVCKPKFGQDYFGKPAAAGVSNSMGAVFSDSGFPIEVRPIAERFGAENIYVVRFNRNGVKYDENDSRDFLKPSECPDGVKFLDLKNDGDINDFCNSITAWVTSFPLVSSAR
jgi:hypothetical protein